ncbi:MAG: class II glutamine amidotransferase [Myxococcaceae bacterium]|nr:class II glutamine amidotransferase [Myxococcaceae bacterium]
MCRLFAIRSEEPVRVNRAFAALKNRSHEHKDGWGLALFDDGAPAIEVSVKAAHACHRFDELSMSLSTKSMLTHLRLASQGDVSERNAHPFRHENWAFMHNGTLQNFDERYERVEALIAPDYRARLCGETDSERCFYLFLTHLRRFAKPSTREAAVALAHTVRDVVDIFDVASTAKERTTTNFVAFDGNTLLACRHGKDLFHAFTGTAHFIASEPLWPDDPWVAIEEDSVLAIDSSLAAQRWAFSQL